MIRPNVRRAVRILAANDYPTRELAEIFGISDRSVRNIVREAVSTAREQLAAHRRLLSTLADLDGEVA